MATHSGNWTGIAIIAAVAVGALVLVLLYTPYGHWKWALGAAALTIVAVMGLNPKVRLLVLGTSCVFAGLVGVASTYFLDFTVRLPSGETGELGIETGTRVEGWIHLALVIIGLIAVGVHTYMNRGPTQAAETVPAVPQMEPLTFVAITPCVRARANEEGNGEVQYRLLFSVSKPFARQVRIIRAELAGAEIDSVLVSKGNGLFADNVVEKQSGCEVRVDLSFPSDLASQLPFSKPIKLLDDRGFTSDPIDIEFSA